MRFHYNFRFFFLVIITISLFSCQRKTEELVTDPLTDYVIPLQPGKYITYRLDSLVYTNFGRNIEIHRYQLKHQVDAQITDNQGRPAYRIYTYIRDSAGTQSWTPNGTYVITPLSKQLEITEDNFRIIKLHSPIVNGFTWKGNIYLPLDPYESLNPSNSYDYGMNDWDFYYDGDREESVSLKGNTYTDVITVEQDDDSFNAPVTDPLIYGSRTRSVEKYSKGIGLIYRHYELWEYEPNTSGPSPYYSGFGIMLWMIDHN